MAAADDIAIVARQEAELVFDGFDADRAFALGSLVREIAIGEGLGVVIDIRFWNRPLFFAATAGINAGNHDWVRRKINVVQRYLKSTYRMVLEQQRPDRSLPPAQNAPIEDFVLAGGAFPITVSGVGPVGAIAVSGLPERDDHNLVVRALCQHLGRDYASIALGPE